MYVCSHLPGGQPIAADVQVPQAIRELWAAQKQLSEFLDITEIEAIGPLVILHNWGAWLKDSLWLHFIDNNGALSSLVKGSSSVNQLDLIVGETWRLIAELQVLVWFDRVDSKSNPIDGVSRGWFEGPWVMQDVVFPNSILDDLACEMLKQCGL